MPAARSSTGARAASAWSTGSLGADRGRGRVAAGDRGRVGPPCDSAGDLEVVHIGRRACRPWSSTTSFTTFEAAAPRSFRCRPAPPRERLEEARSDGCNEKAAVSIQARHTKRRATVYDVRLRSSEGRVVTRTFSTKQQARLYEAEELSRIARGTWVDPRAASLTMMANQRTEPSDSARRRWCCWR